MGHVIFVQPNGERDTVDVPNGMTIMQGAVDGGIDGIIGACAGSCSCGTCHVYVDNNWLGRLPKMGREEDDRLDEVAAEVKRNSRMACCLTMTPQLDGLVVHVPDTQD